MSAFQPDWRDCVVLPGVQTKKWSSVMTQVQTGIQNYCIHWLQGSYRFLDPKFKTFFQTFSKTIISFSILKIIKQVINRDLYKMKKKKVFPWCAANVQMRLNKIWPAQKKISLVTFKKTLSRLYQYFFQDWKIAGQISRLCMNLEIAYMYSYSFHVGCPTDKQW